MTTRLTFLLLLFASLGLTAQAQNCQAFFTVQGNPAGTTFAFTDSSNGGAMQIISWSWDFGDGNTSTVQNPTHTYNVPGPFLVCLTISNGSCTSVYCDSVGFGGGPSCTATPSSSVSGNTANFSVSTSGTGTAVAYSWDFGDGNSATTGSSSTTHTYANNGTYNACVTVSFSDSCVAGPSCTTVQIGTTQVSCSASFLGSAQSSSASFIDNSTTTGTIVSWTWDFGDGSNPVTTTSGTTTHNYAQNGMYLVCMTIFTSDSCTDTFCDSIVIGNNTPNCQASFLHYPDTTGQYTIIGVNTSQGQNLSYFWDFGDGNTSTQAYPIHQYAGAGTYNICLTVVDSTPASVCTSTFCDSVTVTQKINAPFTFAVLNGASSVNPVNIALPELSLWPNPATDRVNLSFGLQEAAEVSVHITDLQGRTVQLLNAGQMSAGEQSLEMNTTGIASGLYLARVQLGEQVVVKKLLID
jgi:PKD repeat protein